MVRSQGLRVLGRRVGVTPVHERILVQESDKFDLWTVYSTHDSPLLFVGQHWTDNKV